ncbi:MAG: hypothetical protein D8M58_16655 [Calditrichaeota bacterium]|nr:MAG: hypothetical protein DWQ03_08385 [Calditrichota bacterium]MBL1207037.1 hypothetical protein [Calditrichota bacterium]NOG46865.1 hypothetical protein [Calditrichota bacterium]
MKTIFLFCIVSSLSAQTSFPDAQKFHNEGKYSQALEILDELIDNEEKPEYFILASKSAFELSEYDDSADYIEEIIENKKDDLKLLRYYSEVLVKQSEDAGVFTQISMIKKMKNNWENILVLDPSDRDVLKYLTRYYLFAPSVFGKDEQEGYAYLERLNAVDKTEALNIKIEYLLEEEQFNMALNVLNNSDIDSSYFILKHKMDIYRFLDDQENLNKIFQEIDSKHFDSENIATLYNTYGYYLLNLERFEDAIFVFKRAVQKSPKKANPYDSLGDGYKAMGNIIEAKRNYRKALEVDPDFEAARINLEDL